MVLSLTLVAVHHPRAERRRGNPQQPHHLHRRPLLPLSQHAGAVDFAHLSSASRRSDYASRLSSLVSARADERVVGAVASDSERHDSREGTDCVDRRAAGRPVRANPVAGARVLHRVGQASQQPRLQRASGVHFLAAGDAADFLRAVPASGAFPDPLRRQGGNGGLLLRRKSSRTSWWRS